MFEGAEVVKEGTWIYGECVKCSIRIIKWNILYGTGDYEDTPEIAEDREVDCYYILIESIINKGEFPTWGSGFLSLKEAVEDIEIRLSHKIEWID